MTTARGDDQRQIPQLRKIKVAIIGAGISGLAVANGLLQDPAQRYDVQLYERDSVAYDLERGGYQLRIGAAALHALQSVLGDEATQMLRQVWGLNAAKAPALVDPRTFKLGLDLGSVKLYPQSRPVLRTILRQVLLSQPLKEERIHFDHQFERYELGEKSACGVTLHFKDGKTTEADILIAADGSGSKINQQTGLNNKVKLKNWTLFQARGSISSETRNALPESLLKYGALLFLGGRRLSGYASVSKKGDLLGTEEQSSKQSAKERDPYYLFWSVLLPAETGESILEKCGDDHELLLQQLMNYLRHDLQTGDALPKIFESTSDNLRTGLLTSSFRPDFDWRQGKAANARVILLGDAVHPMTPGRGMGANQALVDASKLVAALHCTDFSGDTPSDEELAAFVRPFDAEMYERAFKMVKASEEMTDLDLTSGWDRGKVFVAGIALTILGWFVSAAELLGLKRVESIEFD